MTPWYLPLFAAGVVCLVVLISIPVALYELACRLPGPRELLDELVSDLAGCYAEALSHRSLPGRK